MRHWVSAWVVVGAVLLSSAAWAAGNGKPGNNDIPPGFGHPGDGDSTFDWGKGKDTDPYNQGIANAIEHIPPHANPCGQSINTAPDKCPLEEGGPHP
jgi:hypothetical protein